MAGVKNACAGPFGAFYDAWIERERVSAVVGRLLWGIDTGPMYKSMREALAEVPDGATVLDVPCGGGVAFRALGREQRVRYLAMDLDQAMLARARRRADRLGLEQIELGSADMRHLPLPDRAADLCLTYSGLHMISDPEVAIAEMARCLRPGGTLACLEFNVPPQPAWRAAWWCYTRLALPVLGGLTGGPAWYRVGRFLGPSISEHYREHPLAWHVAAWQAAGLTEVGTEPMSLGGGLVMWGRKGPAS